MSNISSIPPYLCIKATLAIAPETQANEKAAEEAEAAAKEAEEYAQKAREAKTPEEARKYAQLAEAAMHRAQEAASKITGHFDDSPEGKRALAAVERAIKAAQDAEAGNAAQFDKIDHDEQQVEEEYKAELQTQDPVEAQRHASAAWNTYQQAKIALRDIPPTAPGYAQAQAQVDHMRELATAALTDAGEKIPH